MRAKVAVVKLIAPIYDVGSVALGGYTWTRSKNPKPTSHDPSPESHTHAVSEFLDLPEDPRGV
jgi:hypothetical protein